MGVTWNKHGMIAALLALFVAVFVLVPNVDAATCGPELTPAEAAASFSAPNHTDTKKPIGDADTCVHGHCHHGGAGLPSALPLVSGSTAAESLAVWSACQSLVSRTPAGPERPPRA